MCQGSVLWRHSDQEVFQKTDFSKSTVSKDLSDCDVWWLCKAVDIEWA